MFGNAKNKIGLSADMLGNALVTAVNRELCKGGPVDQDLLGASAAELVTSWYAGNGGGPVDGELGGSTIEKFLNDRCETQLLPGTKGDGSKGDPFDLGDITGTGNGFIPFIVQPREAGTPGQQGTEFFRLLADFTTTMNDVRDGMLVHVTHPEAREPVVCGGEDDGLLIPTNARTAAKEELLRKRKEAKGAFREKRLSWCWYDTCPNVGSCSQSGPKTAAELETDESDVSAQCAASASEKDIMTTIAEDITKSDAPKKEEDIAEDVTKSDAPKKEEDIAEDITKSYAPKKEEDITEDITKSDTPKKEEDITEDTTKSDAPKKEEDITEDITKGDAPKKEEDITEDITKSDAANSAEDITEDVAEDMTKSDASTSAISGNMIFLLFCFLHARWLLANSCSHGCSL